MLWILTVIVIFLALEILIITQLGGSWGTWLILGAIFATALIGSILVRWQGISVLRDVQHEMHNGRLPTHQVLEGLCLLCAALFLVTPGFVSDVAGFLVLFPALRNLAIRHLKKWVAGRTKDLWSNSQNTAGPPTINGTFVDTTDRQAP